MVHVCTIKKKKEEQRKRKEQEAANRNRKKGDTEKMDKQNIQGAKLKGNARNRDANESQQQEENISAQEDQ